MIMYLCGQSERIPKNCFLVLEDIDVLFKDLKEKII